MADPTIIGAQTQVSGRISGDADLSVEGRVDGTIELSETLTIAQGGVVTGSVKARQVIIEGYIDGEISAEERVILRSSARAVANILAPLVEMADGAQLRGELNVGVDAEAPTAARAPARTSESTRSVPASSATSASNASRPTPVSRTSASASSAAATAPSSPTTTTVVVEEEPEAEPEPAAEFSEVTEAEPEVEADVEVEADLDPETFHEFEEDYTVKELKEQLRALDLPVSGTKSELIERLLYAQAQVES